MNAFTRRQAMGATLGGFFGMAMRNRMDGLFAASPGTNGQPRTASRCLVLWMGGGPSQLDTFDPKPGTATGGEFQAIRTAAPDLRISETLPNIARAMGELSVIRNLTSREGAHERGQYYLHTGFRFNPSFPRPSLGSVVSHEKSATDFPKYVTVGAPGFGPAFMGPEHAPFSIGDAAQAREILGNLRRHRSRLQFLNDLGGRFDQQHRNTALSQRKQIVSSIDALSATGFVEALDLQSEPDNIRHRYGQGEFADQCLLARRLLELGVNYVEIRMDGWDTHDNNFRRVRQLCQAIDRPWASLMEDLGASGLLQETVVVWMGEFGRTPTINKTSGRDHFPLITPVVIGGGPVVGGQAIGQTNKTGTEIVGESHSIADLFATLYTALGIDVKQTFTTEFDSPTTVTDNGQVIDSLLAKP